MTKRSSGTTVSGDFSLSFLWQHSAENILQGEFKIVIETALEFGGNSGPLFLGHFFQKSLLEDGADLVEV